MLSVCAETTISASLQGPTSEELAHDGILTPEQDRKIEEAFREGLVHWKDVADKAKERTTPY